MDMKGRKRNNFHSIADLIKPPEQVEDDSVKDMKDNQVNPVQSTESRKERTIYKAHQVYLLEQVFAKTHYPDGEMVENLSRQLDIIENKIKVWFQNKRARWRRRPSSETANDFSHKENSYGPYMYPRFIAEGYGCFPKSMWSANVCPQNGIYTDNRIVTARAGYYPDISLASKPNILPQTASGFYMNSYRNRFQNLHMYNAKYGQFQFPAIGAPDMYYCQRGIKYL